MASNAVTNMLPAFQNAKDQEHCYIDCPNDLPYSLNGVECFFVTPGTFTIPYPVQRELEAETKDFSFNNLFDCLPLISRVGFDVSAKKISYTSKLTAQKLKRKIFESHGYPVGYTGPGIFGTDPNQSALARTVFAYAKAKKADADGICAGRHVTTEWPREQGKDWRVVCTNQAGELQYVNPNTLEPAAWENFGSINPAFSGSMSSAKPAVDPKTGETFTVLYTPGMWYTNYKIVSIGPNDDRNPPGEVVCTVSGPGSIVHSLAVTPNYIILALFPFKRVMAVQDSVLNMFKFDRLRVTMFYVINRKTKKHVGVFRAPAVYSLSLVNAYEDKDAIHVDMTTYESDDVHATLQPSPYATPPPSGTLSRFSLNDAANGQGPPPSEASSPFAGSTKLVYNLELPTMNPRWRTRKHRFVYGCSVLGKNRWWTRIVKIDLDHPESPAAVWSQPHHFPSTLLFVPDPSGDSREDQGHLVTYVFSSQLGKSYLLVLNAERLQEVTKVELPQVVPLAFSGGAYARRAPKSSSSKSSTTSTPVNSADPSPALPHKNPRNGTVTSQQSDSPSLPASFGDKSPAVDSGKPDQRPPEREDGPGRAGVPESEQV
ncbi:hypothetical protein M427DRAFT_142605 [Gonapodya prolifera JEL478]|uniref:Carotenoid oxygenase n=1 Tax=Gonapodya prolifera (strain JEL478) TaxID=1344416 RepID=A0A139AVZ6_GONPJ|nr:hypothetical protein M427DRAFT_142605 [Gonapodya prolifera JEL478]|eukprot:KXS20906.1 hypothetical protein M427DRAFT_142605 [Gonapodya prolifera JEL478]